MVLSGPRTFVASTRNRRVRTVGFIHPRSFGLILRRLQAMTQLIRRAWHYAVAVGPIAAIVLVEAAMRRWG